MRDTLLKWILGLVVFFHLAMTAQAADTFTLDPDHSYILWHASHFDFSSPSGKWPVNGTVTLDKEHPQKSYVNVTIDLSELNTGIPALDKHLKGELFLNVANYPVATFVSDKVIVLNNSTAKVHGMLTLHGVTNPVVLNVKLNKVGISPVTDKLTVGFSASTTLKRSDFGITSLLPGVGDEVKIDIEAEAHK